MTIEFNLEKYNNLVHPDLVNLGIHITAEQHKYDYADLFTHIKSLKNKKSKDQYINFVRNTADTDFWFFAYYILELPISHPYLIALAYRLQEHVNDPYLYLAAGRGCWKSTFLTIALSLWEVSKDPNITNVILSYERQMAIKQLRGVKRTAENCPKLGLIYPDIFYTSDDFRAKRTEKWNEYDGLFVKRSLNSSDPSWAGYGFVEGIPTGTHFKRLLVDDPVTLDNVATVDSIRKVDDGFKMLTGIKDKISGSITRVVTTRYDVQDLSKSIIEDQRYHHIIIPAEVTAEGIAQFDSIPVYLTREQLDDERTNYGDDKYAAQMLQNPTLGGGSALSIDWIRYYDSIPSNVNYYMLCDPAGSKSKRSDFSVFVVIAVSSDKQFFLVDMIRDKLDVYERFETLIELHKRYRPDAIYYEQQAMQSDIEVFDREMRTKGYFIHIDKYSSNIAGSKHRRIKDGLGGMFRKSEFLIPEHLYFQDRDLIEEFIQEEYSKYPNNRAHDDMLDAMSMITQVPITVPLPKDDEKKKTIIKEYNPLIINNHSGSWMSDFCETW